MIRVFQSISIRQKQILIIMLTTGVALLLACATFVSFETVHFRRDMVQNLSTLAKIIGNNSVAALDFNDPQAAGETLSGLTAQSNIIGACVYSKSGNIFAQYDRPSAGARFRPPSKPQAAGHLFGQESLALIEPINSKGDVIGAIYLESDMRGLQSKLTQFAAITAAVFLLTLLVAFLLSAQLQRLISEPILELVRTARAVAQDKDYSVRVVNRRTDEIGVLMDGFNEMLTQIQHRDAALQSGRDGLEARVAERTAELATSNEALLTENAARKQTEKALSESDEKFRQLAENISDVFWITSPDMQQVHYVSPAFARLWGRSVESLYARSQLWSEGIVPEDRERVMATFGRLVAGEENVSEEFRVARPNGEMSWINSRGFLVRDAAGKVIRLTGIASDITRRKQFESQLLQSQRMETVGKLAGGIAHEFNSILTAILGQSELLLGDLPAGSSLAKNATEIIRAATRAAALTRQLLAYGRKQILQPEDLDLNKVIASMKGVLAHLMGPGVDTQIVPCPDLKAVQADAGQIEQVIINMAINAREAMPNGGKLTLETANVSFDQDSVGRYPELRAGDYVMLAITDTGVGMRDEVKARAFEPFFSTKVIGQGTGLGLSTCYGIVKQSGGHISVYSEQGRGATFKIYLPQVQPKNTPAVQRLNSDLPRGTETILLVEDDPALREMAGTLLRRLGYVVLSAANGIEALRLKQQRGTGHIDLLFTDVVMPHMSGKELADRVQVLYPHTRILFTSAYTENAIVHQGVLNKGVALLQKPFTPSALAYKLREVLDQPSAHNSEAAPETSDANHLPRELNTSS
jgi:PAS domain S-box-containing protein